MSNQDDNLHPVMDGVIIQPGVPVFCDDRDEPEYDNEGIIVAARSLGHGTWEFDILFGSQTIPTTLRDRQIWPQSKAVRDAPPPPNAIRVFLCHGKEDKAGVRELYAELRKRGMAPWLDEEDLQPGVEWELAIRNAVRDSDVVIVCLSQKSTSKTGFVQKEIRIALDAADERPEGAIYIIPAKLQECELPQRLSRWQAVALFEPGGLFKLIGALERHPNRKNADAGKGRRTYWRHQIG